MGPSCHQKKVLLFGELLKRLCQIANKCLLEYLRQVTRQPDGQLGMIMTIHIPRSRDEYMGYNCHLHALVADGLFSPSGMFYVAPIRGYIYEPFFDDMPLEAAQ